MEAVVAQVGAIIVAIIGTWGVLRSQQMKTGDTPDIPRGQVVEPDYARVDLETERAEHAMCHAVMREHGLIPPHD